MSFLLLCHLYNSTGWAGGHDVSSSFVRELERKHKYKHILLYINCRDSELGTTKNEDALTDWKTGDNTTTTTTTEAAGNTNTKNAEDDAKANANADASVIQSNVPNDTNNAETNINNNYNKLLPAPAPAPAVPPQTPSLPSPPTILASAEASVAVPSWVPTGASADVFELD